MDFTLKIYQSLLETLRSNAYSFQTFENFITAPKNGKVVVLRHDVDMLPYHSLLFARIQTEHKIKGTYYFRVIPQSWDEQVILQIAELGHEIGYHYETMDTSKGNVDKAWDEFRYNLDHLRKLTNVTTICMHGSPRSKYDNRALWQKYDYKSLGIIGEPYYDINFNKVFYITDTGRRWDGWKMSVRDKVSQQEEWIRKGWVYHSTKDIIKAIESGSFPNQVIMTFHPQRWHDKPVPWLKELVLQRSKNIVKWGLIKLRNDRIH